MAAILGLGQRVATDQMTKPWSCKFKEIGDEKQNGREIYLIVVRGSRVVLFILLQ